MKPRDLQRVVDFWAPRLGLGSWHLRVYVRPRFQVDTDGGWLACTKPDSSNGYAPLVLAVPREFTDDPSAQNNHHDVESSLVHEMLHAALDHWGMDTDCHHERAVNGVTRALLSLHRVLPSTADPLKLDPCSLDRDPCRERLWIELVD